ncbi:hypothetical protein [Ancylobacter amanitiformis]|uniref:Uncharacterized protein n=1 Tax=Ancylobacter amanitiformis TaxID=217069 RepID=A0ABU0LXF5_9HYPH|nr:hypothetical protein [Ancylobacter amanitiformis]MDQ0513363.1 hypothetical protein [Ancylobacter amanitiformis]
MTKFIAASAALATIAMLGFAAGAQAQTYAAPHYAQPAPGYPSPMVVEGRNSGYMTQDEAQRYVPEPYATGTYLGPSPYPKNPGVEPYIAKQVDRDQRGD